LRTYINHFFILFAKLIYSGIVLLIFFIVDMSVMVRQYLMPTFITFGGA